MENNDFWAKQLITFYILFFYYMTIWQYIVYASDH